MTPVPAWPVLALASIQAADAVFCAIPLPFVTSCLDDVGFPNRYRPVLAPIKACAAAGLVAGLWVPKLTAVASGGLVLYFSLAVGAHVRKRDIGRNMLNAGVMLVASSAVLARSS